MPSVHSGLFLALLIFLSLQLTTASLTGIAAQTDLVWESVPLTTLVDLKNERPGGEGFQMVQSIVIAPSDPSIMYMSTDTSQVWKSDDHGNSWYSERNGYMSHGASSLAIIPDNPEIVIAAGSYGANRKRAAKYPNRVEGVYITKNGGESWVLVKKTNFYRTVIKGNLIAVANDGAQGKWHIIVGSHSEGLLISRDMGETWDVIESSLSDITDIYTIPGTRHTLIIASGSGLYRYDVKNGNIKGLGKDLPGRPLSTVASPDGKKIWVTVKGYGIYKSSDSGLSFDFLGIKNARTLAISPVDPDLLFVKGHMSNPRAPLVSFDGGISWEESTYDEMLDPKFDKPHKQFWFSAPFAPHPVKKHVVFTVSNGKGRILKSVNSGLSWRYSGSGFTGARLKDAYFSQEGALMFAFTDHGIWASNRGYAGPFRYIATPTVNKLNSCSAIAVSGETIIAAIGSWKKKVIVVSEDNGKTWAKFDHTMDNYRFIGFHPKDPRYVFAGKYISKNKGKSWELSSHKVLWIDSAGNIYAAESDNKSSRVVVSSDKGINWDQVTNKIPVKKSQIKGITIGEDPEIIYLATTRGVYIFDGKQWKYVEHQDGMSKDAYGLTYVEDIITDPARSGFVFAVRRSPGWGQSNGVFYSNNFGYTWKNINLNLGPFLTVWSITMNPYDENVLIGTSLGVFRLNTRKLIYRNGEESSI